MREEQLKRRLWDEFLQYKQSDKPSEAYPVYQAAVRRYAEMFPEQMAALQQKNTERTGQHEEQLMFDYPNSLGLMDEILRKEGRQHLNIPIGYENATTLDGAAMAMTLPPKGDRGAYVHTTGNPADYDPAFIMMHEMGHVNDRAWGVNWSNEDHMRSLDFLRAYMQNDTEMMKEAVEFSRKTPSELLPNGLTTLARLYRKMQPAIPENYQAKIESTLAKLDATQNNALAKLLGVETRQVEFDKVDKATIQMLIDIAPSIYSTQITDDNKLRVKLDR